MNIMTLNQSYTPEEREAIEALKRFVVDNPELEKLEDLLSEFNIFEALGIERQELRHSNFFAWLMDPKGNHGLGDYFLSQFIKMLARISDDERINALLFDMEISEGLVETEIFREWNNIDIFIINKALGFTITVENKFLTKEHSDQLRRYKEMVETSYPGLRNIFVYLTPDQKEPEGDKSYIPVGYVYIVDIIEHVLTAKSSVLNDDVKVLLNHYITFIRRYLMGGEVERLCVDIYKKHKKALDLIFEHAKRSSVSAMVRNLLVDLLPNKGFNVIYDSKSYIRFLPKEWDFIPNVSYWKFAKRENMPLLCFEFYNTEQYGLTLYLLCNPVVEDKVSQYASAVNVLLSLGFAQGKPFKSPKDIEKSLKGLLDGSVDRAAIYSIKVCSPKDYESLSIEEIRDKVQDFLDSFKENDLKTISEEVATIFKNN